MYQNLAILAAFVLVYSAVAGRIEKTPISGAIVAMGFGFACGPLGLGIFTPHVDGELLRTLAELTLALVLFTDAANANLSVLKISLQIPERLLLIGLPLTILLGFGIGISGVSRHGPVRARRSCDHAGADRRRPGQGRRDPSDGPGRSAGGLERGKRAQRRNLRSHSVRVSRPRIPCDRE